jgi:calcium channel MID1
MQLSPLQSRLAASLLASCLLIALYFTLFSPHFAIAHNVPGNSPIVLDDADLLTLEPRGPLDPIYEPEFAAFDRSILGRAPAGVTALTNNEAMPMNAVTGSTQLFMFTADTMPARAMSDASLELRVENNGSERRSTDSEGSEENEEGLAPGAGLDGLVKRQVARTVYISANTCEQPRPLAASNTTADPPQLTLYVSNADSNQSPGPLADAGSQFQVNFTEGAVMFNLTVSGDVYVGVHAPNATGYTGQYNFRVAASTDGYFYTYNERDDADLIWVDSDAQGALLITHNLTESTDPAVEQKIMSMQPYVMFAHNSGDKSINGLKLSYCGLQNHAQIAATKNGQFTSMVSTGMTKRGQGNLPKQQFFFSGLNSSASYLGILARDGNSSVSGNGLAGGGGHVFKATSFSTKSGW